MTFMDQTNAGPSRPAARRNMAKLINWWFERQRLKRDFKKLAEMPDYLLSDVGLEHLIDFDRDFDRDTTFHNRLF